MFQSKGSYGRMNTLPEAVHMLIYRICQSVISYDKMHFQFSAVIQSCPTLCNPVDCRTPGFPVHHQLPKLAQTHVHQVGDAIQPSHPVVPFSFCLLPSIFPSIRVFSNESVLPIRWPTYSNFSFSIVLPMYIQD